MASRASAARGIPVASNGGHRLLSRGFFGWACDTGRLFSITPLHILMLFSLFCHALRSLPAPGTCDKPASEPPSSAVGPKTTSPSAHFPDKELLSREESSSLRTSEGRTPTGNGREGKPSQSKQIPRVSDAELDHFLNFAEDIRDGRIPAEWAPLVEGPPVTVWRRVIPGQNRFVTGQCGDDHPDRAPRL